MTVVNCPTGQLLSIKVKILPLQWAAPQGTINIINILYQKERVKVNIQNNPIIHYICNLY